MSDEQTHNKRDRSTQVRHFVYVVAESEDGPIKIGRSKSPFGRIATLQTANPRRLIVVGIWEVDDPTAEKQLIEDLTSYLDYHGATHRILMGEWFDYPASLFDDDYMNDFFGSVGIGAERVR